MATPPSDPAPPLDKHGQDRLRIAVALVLVPLFLTATGLALAGLWPASMLDAWALEHLGFTSWSLRIVGSFVVLAGGFVLPVLVVLAVVVNLWRAVRG